MANNIVISGNKKEILWQISEMEFEPDVIYEFKGGVQGQKRSLDANSYAWLLMDRLAKQVDSTKDEIYLHMLERYGTFVYLPVLEENVEAIKKVFRIVKDRGEVVMTTRSGKTVKCRQLQCYKGSSLYDTKEMARLIDGIISEAKPLGVQVETPDEVERIKAAWGR